MTVKDAIEKLSRKYSDSEDDFMRHGFSLAVREKERALKIERLEILARYGVATVDELRRMIADGGVAEHPGWEDLIEIKNIESEIAGIESDIRDLQAA